jgi:anti-sigma regulatory factor (Ser/Thr protein kinase)
MLSLAEADPECQMRQLTLPLAAESASCARGAVRRTLAYWGLSGSTDDAVLLVSELVGNAVCHAGRHADDLVLSLTCCESVLRIEVRDGDPCPPQPRAPGLDAESGFGFVIVAALASDWGVYQADSGKAVWAELPTSPLPR